jgi:branched-subunit amino acid transport protein AzlD
VTLRIKQYVLWLEISVEDRSTVQIFESYNSFRKVKFCHVLTKEFSIQSLILVKLVEKLSSGAKFEDQEQIMSLFTFLLVVYLQFERPNAFLSRSLAAGLLVSIACEVFDVRS